MSRKLRVLVVDDEAYVRDSLLAILGHEGFDVLTAASGREGAGVLRRERLDAVVADLSMPGGDGLEFLEAARGMGAGVPVIVITGVGTIPDAVAAMKLGAYDLLQKPVAPADLVRTVRRAAEHKSLVGEVQRLRAALDGIRGARRLVGESPALRRVREQLARIAPSETTVLVQGESGTGKELAAEELHRLSGRESAPFVRLCCAGLGAQQLELELFGHSASAAAGASGARAGCLEQAEGGTLVLDQIDALPPELQQKLLRVLDTHEYQRVGEATTRRFDARLVVSTSADLAAAVEQGRFRADLYYRANGFPIEMPPLRAHKEDLPELVAHLLERPRRVPAPGPTPTVAPEVIATLTAYDWPGNVRELENVLERAWIVGGQGELDAELIAGILEATMARRASASASVGAGGGALPDLPHALHLRTNLDAREKELLQQALALSGGRKKDAANLLGVDARNLGYYLRKHGLH